MCLLFNDLSSRWIVLFFTFDIDKNDVKNWFKFMKSLSFIARVVCSKKNFFFRFSARSELEIEREIFFLQHVFHQYVSIDAKAVWQKKKKKKSMTFNTRLTNKTFKCLIFEFRRFVVFVKLWKLYFNDVSISIHDVKSLISRWQWAFVFEVNDATTAISFRWKTIIDDESHVL